MDQIFINLNEALDRAKKIIRDNEIRFNELSHKELELLIRENKLKEAESSFSQREYAVQQIEDIIKLKSDADMLMAQAKQIVEDLGNQKAALRHEQNLWEQNKQNDLALSAQHVKNNEDNRKALEAKHKTFDEIVNKRVNEIVSKLKV